MKEISQAISIHVQFLTDQAAFRWVLRCDGKTIDNRAITPFNGTNLVSPFTCIAQRREGFSGMTVFVGNLSFSVREIELSEVFAAYGEVSYCRIPVHRDSGESKGYGFVTMRMIARVRRPLKRSTVPVGKVGSSWFRMRTAIVVNSGAITGADAGFQCRAAYQRSPFRSWKQGRPFVRLGRLCV
jgi:hypothetical protein